MSAPDSSTHQSPPKPASDIPVPTSDPPAEDATNSSDNPEAPSPVKTTDLEVEFLKSQFVEPRRPTVLAKCTAKEELAERQKAKQDITDYTHLSIGDIVSGFKCTIVVTWKLTWWNKYNTNLRYNLCYFPESYLLYQPPSLLLMNKYAVDLENCLALLSLV